MQDNFEKAWKEQLGNYQAPADPQDWAAMSAMLDEQEQKKAGFMWAWVLGFILLSTLGVGTYQWLKIQHGTGSNNIATSDGPLVAPENNSYAPTENSDNSNNTIKGDNNNPNIATLNKDITTNAGENATAVGQSNVNNNPNAKTNKTGTIKNTTSPTSENTKRSKKRKDNAAKGNNGAAPSNNNNNNNTTNTVAGTVNADKTPTTNSNKKPKTTTNSVFASGSGNTPNVKNTLNNEGNVTGYNEPVASLSMKRLRQLPNNTELVLLPSNDTISKFKMQVIKPKKVQHYLGVGLGWVTARVDRSGDFRAGYNTGIQYTMMVKQRFGIHAGLAFRKYNYFTDLVACNYELYQCPNSYSSTLQTIDLHVGAQVNLVKTDKIEWYVMGGVNNQFMMQENFEYNLPAIDTVPQVPLPVTPPVTTSFTGAGASDFNESISVSADFNSLTSSGNVSGEGKFLRERYLGGWYAGTGVTWHFVQNMSLQVEPVIGRSFQFVGIQDKKLWNAGVNLRVNVKLGR